MRYGIVKEGVFLRRPNRFIAHVEIGGNEEICHVKNTGRCKELLVPGCRVFVEEATNPARKTKYDLISVYKGTRLINMDSQAPNKVFQEYLAEGKFLPGLTELRPETSFGNSRFDFYARRAEQELFIEVKGVTLEENGVALFPDAPTQRGVKHLEELITCRQRDYDAYAVFVIQMQDVSYFTPNRKTHPAFAAALEKAQAAGVKLFAYDCRVSKEELIIRNPVPVRL